MDGETPLYWATREGQVEAIVALLDCHKAKIDLADKKGGYTPISIAVHSGNLHVAKIRNPSSLVCSRQGTSSAAYHRSSDLSRH